ncbi:hypothetical protein V6C27_07980 [Peptococcaceae bacterium 1198_IL3148]
MWSFAFCNKNGLLWNNLKFYYDVLGLEIIADFGANVTLSVSVVLKRIDTWKDFIRTDKIFFQNNARELYFEGEDMGTFAKKLFLPV